jgi:type I restriction enzyme S subunit
MEVAAGYKRTDIGVIPADWEVIAVGDLVEPSSPVRYGVVQVGEDTHGGVPIVSIKHVKDIASAPLHRASAARESRYSRSRVKGGDVLIAIKGTIGRVGVVPAGFSGNISRELARLRPRREYIGEYIAHQLESDETQARISKAVVGTTRLEFSIATLRRFELPIPRTPDEQRAIAEALNDVDALLNGLDRLIAKKRDLKQAVTQQLLTGRKRLPGFTGEWDVKPFDAVLVRLNAKEHQIQTSDYRVTGKYPVIDQGSEPIVGFSDREEKRLRCPEGGVIVFGDHTCVVKFIDFDFLVGADGTQILRARVGQNTRFHAFQLQNRGVEPTGYNRHFKFLKEKEFVTPPLPEQTAIATVLADMDAELAALGARRAKTRDLKQAMMQELLTGKARLVFAGVGHA